MKLNVEKVQKQVMLLLTSKGLNVDDEPLAEFIMDDKNANPAIFSPESLPEGNLWFGAGSLIEEDDDIEVFSVSDTNDDLVALATVKDDVAEVWVNNIGHWR
ncbi:MAG: hypothetical protein K0Q49_2365 [Haloplasmataceae bacterium]|nr:hypothetical protein [Haloplasmataceae bacterium]